MFDLQCGRFIPDVFLRATTAPSMVRVQNANVSTDDNSGPYGDYAAVCTHAGRPAYQKPGTQFVIRYHAPHSRWVIDPEGLRDSDACIAYAGRISDPEHPVGSGPWYVFDATQGVHVQDRCFSVVLGLDGRDAVMEGVGQNLKMASTSEPLRHDRRRFTNAGA